MTSKGPSALPLALIPKITKAKPAKAQLAHDRFALWCDLITQTRSINAALAG